jgi:uncharacterized protein YigA (DUF484 family)
MATVIPFEERAVAHLRQRLGVVEEANQDLIAFARGHSGAVSSIHAAVLAAVETDSIDALLHVVTQEWPLILRIDAVALSLIVGDKGFRADGGGVQVVDPNIRIDCEPPLPVGLLALGQRAELSLDARHGSELLMFLGRSLAAMIRKWLVNPQQG